MAFSTGNPQFDFLLSRARNRKRAKDALQENNIEVETSKEEQENSENETQDRPQVADIGGLGASGVSVTGPSQAIADANQAMDIAGVGAGQTAGQVAFGTERDRAKSDFAQSNPVGAAIAGFSTDAIAQGVVSTAPLGLAMAGQMEAAKMAANVGSVLGSPAFGMISGIIGPTMQDPYGQNVAMGSGLLGQVSNSLMSTHYSVADKISQGVPGYAQGYYQGDLVSVTPGLFGIGKTYTGVNVPDVSVLSPTEFMDMLDKQEVYNESVDPFGGLGSTSVISDPSTISVDTFDTVTDAAQAGVGYSSYSPTGNPTGAAPAGSQYSATGIFSSNDNNDSDNNNNNDSGFDSNTGGGGADDYGSMFKKGGSVGMQMGGDPTQQQAPTGEMGFIGGPPDQFTEQQTIADDIPKEVPEGTFVINAPAVEFAGKEDIKDMLVKAYEIVAQADIDAGTDRTAQAANIPTKEQVDIMISRGEVVVPPEIAKVIGYDKLEKINNRGKKEVSRRQENAEAQRVAEGGFIGMQEGGNTEDEFGVTIKNVKFKDFYSSPEEARKEIDKILNNLPLEDALAIAMEGEADVLGDEGLEGVGHVFRNRAMAEGYKDFGNSLAEELSKKTYGKNKIFQFNALEPTKFRNTLKRFKQNEDRYLKVRNIAEDIVAGSRKDFTKGALFFKNPTSSEAKDFKSKVQSGEYIETGRTVNPKNKVFAHIYYKPKDFKLADETPTQVEESFVSVNNDDIQPPRKIPESTGGSFLGRGSAYETGGARPAFR